jgi:DNA-binding transcriptional regulator YiaG
VRALRRHLGLSQAALSSELGVRQQTVSEWETGLYQPRGASARLLTLVAERADFRYGDEPGEPRP